MAILKSILLLLAITTTVNGFSALKRPGLLRNVVQMPAPTHPHDTSTDKTFSRSRGNSTPEKRLNHCYSSSLYMSSSDLDNDDSPWYSQVSVPYALALVVFIGFAAFLAPGEFGSSLDNEMIQAYIDNPTYPGLNPIFNAEFNLLGAAALVLAGLVLPQAVPSKGLPPGPFLAAASFAGYGGLGPYMTFRKGPRENVTQSDLGWVAKNIFENKFVNLAILALCLLQYYIMAGPLLQDPSGVWQDFVGLVQTSKFASVSSLDLLILSLTGASLIPLDYRYRRPVVDETQVTLIAASTLLLPMLGSAIYCALRPPLPGE